MSLPPAMSHTTRDNPPPPSMRGLWVLIIVLLVLGAVGFVADVQTARNTSVTSRADIIATADLVRQVRELEREAREDQAEHREFNQADHKCLIALLLQLAEQPDRPVDAASCRPETLPAGGQKP